MTRLLLLAPLALALAACRPETVGSAATQPERPAVEPSQSVAEATRQVLAAIQNDDAEAIRAAFAESNAVVAIGSDPTENFHGYAQTTDVFATHANALSGVTIEAGAIEAYEHGGTGWSSSQPVFRFADGTSLPLRLTVVFTSAGDSWKIVQWHSSLGVGNDDVSGFDALPSQ